MKPINPKHQRRRRPTETEIVVLRGQTNRVAHRRAQSLSDQHYCDSTGGDDDLTQNPVLFPYTFEDTASSAPTTTKRSSPLLGDPVKLASTTTPPRGLAGSAGTRRSNSFAYFNEREARLDCSHPDASLPPARLSSATPSLLSTRQCSGEGIKATADSGSSFYTGTSEAIIPFRRSVGSFDEHEALHWCPSPQETLECSPSDARHLSSCGFVMGPKPKAADRNSESSLFTDWARPAQYLRDVTRQPLLGKGIREQLRKGVSFTANVVGEAVHVTNLRGVPTAPPAPSSPSSLRFGFEKKEKREPIRGKTRSLWAPHEDPFPWHRWEHWQRATKRLLSSAGSDPRCEFYSGLDNLSSYGDHVDEGSPVSEPVNTLWSDLRHNREHLREKNDSESQIGLLDDETADHSTSTRLQQSLPYHESLWSESPIFTRRSPDGPRGFNSFTDATTRSEPLPTSLWSLGTAEDEATIGRSGYSYPELVPPGGGPRQPGPSQTLLNKLVFMTFNVGLLEYRLGGISWYRNPPFTKRRLYHIAPCLKNSGSDVVALQEVYDEWQADFLIESLRVVFPFVARRTSGGAFSLHNGLMLMSRFPILHTAFHLFQSVTAIEKMFGSKGILEATVEVPTVGRVTFINIHLASGAVDPESSTLEMLRNEEILQVLQVCQAAENRGEVPVIIGDLNAAPNVCPSNYKAFLQRGWRDAFLLAVRGAEVNNTTEELERLELWQAEQQEQEQQHESSSHPLLVGSQSSECHATEPPCDASFKQTKSIPIPTWTPNYRDYQWDTYLNNKRGCPDHSTRIPGNQNRHPKPLHNHSLFVVDCHCTQPITGRHRRRVRKRGALKGFRVPSMPAGRLLQAAGNRDFVAEAVASGAWKLALPEPRSKPLLKAKGANRRSVNGDTNISGCNTRGVEMTSPHPDTVVGGRRYELLPTESMAVDHAEHPNCRQYTPPPLSAHSVPSVFHSKRLRELCSKGGSRLRHSYLRDRHRFRRRYGYFTGDSMLKGRRLHCMNILRPPCLTPISQTTITTPAKLTKHDEKFQDPFCTRLCTWDPLNPLNAIGPHAECHGLRCDHIFLPPKRCIGGLESFEVTSANVLFVEPQVTVQGFCCGFIGQASLVTLSDHYAVRIEFTRTKVDPPSSVAVVAST